MTNAIIGADSILNYATVTSSAPVASVANAYDYRLDDYWQPVSTVNCFIDADAGSSQSGSYMAFYSSDFYALTGARIRLMADDFSPPTTVIVDENITTPGPKLFTFATTTKRYWRVNVLTTNPEQPKIQMLSFGVKLELEQGLRVGLMPPALGNKNQPSTNVSEGGIFIGRSNQITPVPFTLSTNVLTPSWVRANWAWFQPIAEKRPFFVLPEPDAYPNEAVYAWTDGPIAAPKYSHSNKMSLDLKLKAFI